MNEIMPFVDKRITEISHVTLKFDSALI